MIRPRPAPGSRLTRFVGLPGGMTADAALVQAERNLEAHQQAAVVEIDRALAVLTEAITQSNGGSAAAQAQIRRTAYEIATTAGLFGLPALGLAAQSLCALIEHCEARRAWDQAGVAVHLAAMRALRRPVAAVAAGEADILAGLARIVSR